MFQLSEESKVISDVTWFMSSTTQADFCQERITKAIDISRVVIH